MVVLGVNSSSLRKYWYFNISKESSIRPIIIKNKLINVGMVTMKIISDQSILFRYRGGKLKQTPHNNLPSYILNVLLQNEYRTRHNVLLKRHMFI